MPISVVTNLTLEICVAFEQLFPQLIQDRPIPSIYDLEKVVKSPSTTFFILRHPQVDSPIVGFAALGMYRTPSGLHAHIEDVVVDIAHRHKGLGEALVRACLETAREAGAAHVDLTSNPRRFAANQLYQKMGFQRRDTNLYRYSF